ncbi:hypothetical protein MAR_036410 [Mya arenaria]|uniref:Uncharacterized protein n=1 Tax=Mya arenaria TaxID=6604 RepID=A0ABY7FPB7_MYAAR|nr:hypothetical protein MAR_036410 [Mya arenaria]
MSESRDNTDRKLIFGRGSEPEEELYFIENGAGVISLREDPLNASLLPASRTIRVVQHERIQELERRLAEMEEERNLAESREENTRRTISELYEQLEARNREMREFTALRHTHRDVLALLQEVKLEKEALENARDGYIKDADHAQTEASLLAEEMLPLKRALHEKTDLIDRLNKELDQSKRKNDELAAKLTYMSEQTAADGGVARIGRLPAVKVGSKLGDEVPTLSQKRRRIECRRSAALECRNCRAVLDTTTSLPCTFHASPPRPYNEAVMLSDKEALPLANKERHFYWPCCRKWAVHEPPGCRSFRNHSPEDDDLSK